ncbi:hypothetical protein [Streptomyces solaniscabiei]|uniref:hypothetical protein n=1 Tax=Streptomyces solaniscabiei TaxID=2683255 RepID=UPI001CE2C575|nr:hypothetical protein [Streptomyces solaniscabiei]
MLDDLPYLLGTEEFLHAPGDEVAGHPGPGAVLVGDGSLVEAHRLLVVFVAEPAALVLAAHVLQRGLVRLAGLRRRQRAASV